MHKRIGTLAVLVVSLSLLVSGQERPLPDKTEVAPGIWLFRTASYGDVGMDGNSIAILSRDGVLVFDTNGTPAAASAVLREIRALTSQPVRYIVNSHWHWDHWYGTEVYTKAFPAVTVIAHEKTRAMMMGPALEFNRPGVERQLPAYIQSLEQRGADKTLIAADRFFLEQKKNVTHTFPSLTYADRMTIDLGERHIEVLHYDRAVTPGDTFLYLPNEKVIVTGDLLVNPVSFALSCYPTGWLRTLEMIDTLDASVIIPGHGAPLRDKTLLRATMDVFRVLLREGKAAKAQGLDPDEAKAAILPGLRELMVTITRDNRATNQAFESQLVDWFLHRVYDELNGPLGDSIAAIPAK